MPSLLTRLIRDATPESADDACRMAGAAFDRATEFLNLLQWPEITSVQKKHYCWQHEHWIKRGVRYQEQARKLTDQAARVSS